MIYSTNEPSSSVGDGLGAAPNGWSFSGEVSKSFDEHVTRSVPDYHRMHSLILNLTDFFVRQDSLVYDLGCSTGSLSNRLAQRFEDTRDRARVVGIDLEPEMIKFAQSNNHHPAISYVVGDVRDTELEKCSFVIMNLTAQFIPPSDRILLFNRIWESLEWSGALILFEKIRGSDARFQEIFSVLYRDFKISRGFSESEIVAKEKSLRGVMEPFSEYGNLQLLREAGFQDIETVFRSIPFSGFLAIK